MPSRDSLPIHEPESDTAPPVTTSSYSTADERRIVELLAGVDEQLRARGHELPGESTPELSGAIACLQLLERAWPRSGNSFPELVLSKFKLIRVLGRGGFGVVYLATDTQLHRQVALKIPWPHVLERQFMDRFLSEARAAALLDHPNIVPLYESATSGPVWYLASAYCDGPTLAQWLADQRQPCPVQLACQWIAQLASAVGYSHNRGVLHRDIKPGNVMLVPSAANAGLSSGNSPASPFRPRLTDFGLAKFLDEAAAVSTTTGLLGTPLYMPPEQITKGARVAAKSSDIYSLGAMLYELLTGKPPFTGDTVLEVLEKLRSATPIPVRQLRAGVPRDLEAICLKCLSKLPADRYVAAEQLEQDLHRFLAGEPVTVPGITTSERIWRWCQQPARIVTAGAVMLVVNVAIIFWMGVNLVGFAGDWIPIAGQTTIADIVANTLLVTLALHVPLLVVGWQTLKQQTWAVVAGFAASLLEMMYVAACLVGMLPPPFADLYNDQRLLGMMFSMILTFFTVQFAAYFMAIPALRWERWHSR